MPKRILFVEGNTDGTVGGSYFLMYDLIMGLDRSRFLPVAVYRRDNFVAERLRQAGVEVVVIAPHQPLVFGANWLNVLLAPVKKLVNAVTGFIVPAVAYAGFLRRRNIDIVNLNNSITRNHPWIVAAWLTRIPCITHEMGINKHYSRLSRFLGRRLAAVICLSHAILDAMRAGDAASDNTLVIHCGIDPLRYRQIESPEQLRLKHAIPGSAHVIGVVGNLRAWKGQEIIVRATGLLLAKYPSIRCVLAGGHTQNDLRYLNHLKELCRQLGIEDNVVFAGFQQNSIDYMRLMDVVAHTSIHPEPFGIVTLEAMLLAKPLVSTTIGGPAEVVVNGVTGILVDPGKPKLLADAIGSLLADPGAAAEMGRRGLQRLQSEFSLQKNLSQTTAVYDRILNDCGRGNERGRDAPIHS